MADYISAPSQTVKEKFSLSGGGSGPTAVEPIPKAKVGSVPVQSLPPPLSMDQVNQFYEPLRKEIENLPPPAPEPVPAQTPPLNAFLAVLGASLGASLTRDPAAAQQVTDYLIQKEQQRKAVEAQNYARDLAFNQDKRNQLIQLRGQALTTALQEAIQANDNERAAKIAQNLEKLRGEVQTQMVIPAEQNKQQAIEQEQGRQARLTLADNIRMQLEKSQELANKPMTAQQLATALDQVNKNKELSTEQEGVLGPAFKWLFGGKTPFQKKDARNAVLVTGFLAGEPQVQETAKKRLVTAVMTDLGFDRKYVGNQKFTKEDEDTYRAYFASLGLQVDADGQPIR